MLPPGSFSLSVRSNDLLTTTEGASYDVIETELAEEEVTATYSFSLGVMPSDSITRLEIKSN